MSILALIRNLGKFITKLIRNSILTACLWHRKGACQLPLADLRSKPPSPAGVVYPLRFLHDLDMHVTIHPRPPDHLRSLHLFGLVNCHLGLVNTVYTFFTCTLTCRCRQVLAVYDPSFGPRSFGRSLHIHPSPFPIHQPELTWLSPLPSTVSTLNTCTSQDKMHVLELHTHALVSLNSKPNLDHLLTISHHLLHMGIYPPCVHKMMTHLSTTFFLIKIWLFHYQLEKQLWAKVPFRCQKFYQNFQIPRHIESLNTCMKH
jgi:hypothetical protein